MVSPPTPPTPTPTTVAGPCCFLPTYDAQKHNRESPSASAAAAITTIAAVAPASPRAAELLGAVARSGNRKNTTSEKSTSTPPQVIKPPPEIDVKPSKSSREDPSEHIVKPVMSFMEFTASNAQPLKFPTLPVNIPGAFDAPSVPTEGLVIICSNKTTPSMPTPPQPPAAVPKQRQVKPSSSTLPKLSFTTPPKPAAEQEPESCLCDSSSSIPKLAENQMSNSPLIPISKSPTSKPGSKDTGPKMGIETSTIPKPPPRMTKPAAKPVKYVSLNKSSITKDRGTRIACDIPYNADEEDWGSDWEEWIEDDLAMPDTTKLISKSTSDAAQFCGKQAKVVSVKQNDKTCATAKPPMHMTKPSVHPDKGAYSINSSTVKGDGKMTDNLGRKPRLGCWAGSLSWHNANAPDICEKKHMCREQPHAVGEHKCAKKPHDFWSSFAQFHFFCQFPICPL